MEFQEGLVKLLEENDGSVTLEQATALLHPAIQHRVMQHLGACRNAGVCVLAVTKLKGNESVISITSPQAKPVAQPIPSVVVGGDA